MTPAERTARLIDKVLGLLALMVFCGGLLFACACSERTPYCAETFASEAPRG